MTLPPCRVDMATWSNSNASIPGSEGEASAFSMRCCTSATSASEAVSARGVLAACGLAPVATATRDGLGLTAGDGVRIGVGIGVLILRVSVAAAPGTGVGSAPSNVEHADVAMAAVSPMRARAWRTTTLRV